MENVFCKMAGFDLSNCKNREKGCVTTSGEYVAVTETRKTIRADTIDG